MKDLTGQRFHCLTVVEFTHKDRNDNAVWRCQCSCGKTTPASTAALQGGRKKSCGHLRREFLRARRVKSPQRRERDEGGIGLDEALTDLGAWR